MNDDPRRRALQHANEIRLARAKLQRELRATQARLTRELREWSGLTDSQKDELLNRWLDGPHGDPGPPL